MSSKSAVNRIGFVDLLFNLLFVVIALFIIAFMLISPIAKKEDIKVRAEFLIAMEWPDSRPEDVDLWVNTPTNLPISFMAKSTLVGSLERDDLGNVNDTINYVDNTGKIHETIVAINKEITTIRGIIPGEYIVNIHLYNARVQGGESTNPYSDGGLPRVKVKPVPVTVSIFKLTPFSQVLIKNVVLNIQGEEIFIAQFKVDKKGDVKWVNMTDPIYFANKVLGPHKPTGEGGP
tara:strand:- start:679 stop:1377 length:699 start_codon:yes stop_codon:yes gene_type:complete